MRYNRRMTRRKGNAGVFAKSGRQPQIQTAAAIDWEKIRARAAAFAKKWESETSEKAEAQTFWNEFFEIFGRARRGLAWYEYHARHHGAAASAQGKLSGRIDMLWPGVLAVEHKSAGKDLGAGEEQLRAYIDALPDDIKPRYGLVCDFARFRLIDSETSEFRDFSLADLPGEAENFGFFVEKEREKFTLELKASRDAVQLMGGIYDALRDFGYDKDVDRLLVRLLFCMFADDTGIFERHIFLEYLEKRTAGHGGDLGAHLSMIFQTLNQPLSVRQKTLPADLQKFPHVNGELFAGNIEMAAFDKKTRDALLDACRFNWSEISPAIFGSLFQTVRDAKARRAGGEHYTSEANIMKVVRPLFLDKLGNALEKAGSDKRALKNLHDKIAAMRFLDPACGCGNFLIVAYRELRRLEMEILWRLKPNPNAPMLDIKTLSLVNVDQFCGIEIDSFPAHIAQTAMWLVDHQMNREASEIFGNYFMRIPLTVSPRIVNANALTTEWESVVKPGELSFILGNPPFVDRKNRSPEQRRDMTRIFGKTRGAGNLDYVSSWYMKAARFIRCTDIRCAFVSTDSIAQSMQASVLWGALYGESVKIHFAHRSFKWRNEANGVAQVHVVVIGFGAGEANGKTIYEYDDPRGEPRAVAAANINAYLMNSPDILIAPRTKPICKAPAMISGSNPIDGGHLLLSPEEKREILKKKPEAAQFVRPAIGGDEFLHGKERWCIWVPEDYKGPMTFLKMRPLAERANKTRIFRRGSDREATRRMAYSPYYFGEVRQPDSDYLVVPQTSSGGRLYIPMGFADKGTIALIKCQIVPNANLFHFGVLSSAMHMAWVRTVGGRLGGGYSYTASLAYNNFPWPENVLMSRQESIRNCARAVLDERKKHKHSTLAELYSDAMPQDLAKAHRALDLEVERAYRSQPFADDKARIEHLFAEYRRLTIPAIPPPKKKRARRKARN